MKTKVYIDGSEGTTGLRINERFQGRDDVEILTIDPEKRKNPVERGKLINASDITFLCLPDAAAIEAVSLVENDHVRIIDSSTAHRTEKRMGLWVSGTFPGTQRGNPHRQAHRRSRLPCHRSHFPSLSFDKRTDYACRLSSGQFFPHWLQRRRKENDCGVRG